MLSIYGYLQNGNTIWWIVLLWLSIYLVATLWVFIYKYFSLKSLLSKEKDSLNSIINAQSATPTSDKLFASVKSKPSRELLMVWKTRALKRATNGLVILSIIASTSPFIGLFGTVVEILDTFAQLGGKGGGLSLDVIAPVISQALVATAAGILVSIPAYSFFLIIKRKIFDLMSLITMQTDILSSDAHVSSNNNIDD